MNPFKIEVLSSEGVAFQGEIVSASFPTSLGRITVLPGHANIVTKLVHGEIIIQARDIARKIMVTGGFLEVTNNSVNVVTEFAVASEEANKKKIEDAIRKAKELKEKKKEFVDLSVVESQLKRSVYELKSNVNLKRKNR